jgi:hypothetical protein
MLIRHRVTGETIEFNKRGARLRRAQRRVKVWADVIDPYIQRLGENYRLVMVTLTYADVDGWKANHIREYMLSLRAILKSRLLAYAWVAEMQRREAVHYHIVLLVKKGANIPMPDSSGMWVHGSSRIETARTPFYVLTYTGKEYQKLGAYPKGLRIFAIWISPHIIAPASRWFMKVSALPAWLREQLKGVNLVGERISRVVGGGWECAGQIYKSPWEVLEYG